MLKDRLKTHSWWCHRQMSHTMAKNRDMWFILNTSVSPTAELTHMVVRYHDNSLWVTQTSTRDRNIKSFFSCLRKLWSADWSKSGFGCEITFSVFTRRAIESRAARKWLLCQDIFIVGLINIWKTGSSDRPIPNNQL